MYVYELCIWMSYLAHAKDLAQYYTGDSVYWYVSELLSFVFIDINWYLVTKWLADRRLSANSSV